MVNATAKDIQKGYDVRWGSSFVNEYARHPDTRFHLNPSFIFQAFGVLQKRQNIKRHSIPSHRRTFTLPVEKRIAKFQFQTLWLKLCEDNCQIKGMNVKKVLTSEQIDLDQFDKTLGPDSVQCNRNISADPYAAAKFFHFVIVALLEELFGIKAYSKDSHLIKYSDGIFGKVASYIGTVKAQGHGALHLHIVVWLVEALTHVQMKEALKSEGFRQKVTSFIKANIRANLDGGDQATVLHMP
ncbi:hypothetical protein PILCRDRAFT_86685 [Piloderma croceum F 1598]|uniref:Helitron helicase-like domain-containing protein n=1 Tax=Piloderma croceum (strain F 1598) TaxID=765440 RepID=A0A0C3G283_PILCF|nr:hypothetical protein PILCRDRAFT_86685 [Piloderma croceum F 1598]